MCMNNVWIDGKPCGQGDYLRLSADFIKKELKPFTFQG